MTRAPGDSPAWRMVGQWFYQDVDLCHADARGAFDRAVRSLDAMTDAELQGLWNRARSDITISGIRAFPQEGRAALAAPGIAR